MPRLAHIHNLIIHTHAVSIGLHKDQSGHVSLYNPASDATGCFLPSVHRLRVGVDKERPPRLGLIHVEALLTGKRVEVRI